MEYKQILEEMDPKYSAFGTIFQVSNLLETVSNRYLDDLTIKQWFLLAVLSTFFKEPPSVSEAAGIMGSSHQNVKQVALKLQKKGYLQIKQDPDDNRISRLCLTEQMARYSERHSEPDERFLSSLFQDFTPEEVSLLFRLLQKLSDSARKINIEGKASQ